jgi:hypothetical protein
MGYTCNTSATPLGPCDNRKRVSGLIFCVCQSAPIQSTPGQTVSFHLTKGILAVQLLHVPPAELALSNLPGSR